MTLDLASGESASGGGGDAPRVAERDRPGMTAGPLDRLRSALRHTSAGDAWRFAWRSGRRVMRRIGPPVATRRAALRAGLDARLRALAFGDPARVLHLARLARRAARRSRFLAEAEALLTARCHGWAAARPLFLRIASGAAGPLSGRSAATLLPTAAGRPAPPFPAVAPAAGRPARLPGELAGRIVVYTALFGPGRGLPRPYTRLEGVRFLCLTDGATVPEGWEAVPIAPPCPDPAAAEAFCKIRPHAVLPAVAPAAEWSLYIAPGTLAVGNLDTLLTRWLCDEDLALWRHPAGADWHDLAEHALIGSPAAGAPPDAAGAAAVLDRALACAAEGLPRDTGICDTRVLWRRHGRAEVAALMDAWWREAGAAPGSGAGPDAFALARLLGGGTAPIQPALLPGYLGPAHDSMFFAAAPEALRLHGAPAPAAAEAPPEATVQPLAPRARGGQQFAPRARGGQQPRRTRLPVAFVYAPNYVLSAATIMRGEQLSRMVAARFPDRYEVTYTADAAALSGQVVVMTKNALRTHRASEIAAIRARNVAVIACWDDDIPDPGKLREVDAQMAVSIRMMIELNRRHPDKPAFLVTNHVNHEIPRVSPPTDRLRTGYFGDLLNTVRPEAVLPMVTWYGIGPFDSDTSWMQGFHHHNCHWILRRRRDFDGWKPFLKGYIAARCGAPVVVARDDGDAAYYLGDDYPFYVGGLGEDALEEHMLRLEAAFGGPDWRMAREIMRQVAARSTDEVVCEDFRAMIEAIVG